MNPIHTLQLSPSLLRRTQLLLDESLVSLLERLIHLNYYPSLCTLVNICHDRLETPAKRDDLARPQRAETFLRLADLTQVSPEALFAASDHRFAPFLTLPQNHCLEIPWIDSTSKTVLPHNLPPGRLHSVLTAQFCPRCLKIAPYHRATWIPTTVTICLEHHCLLVNKCPRCKKRISIQEIVRRQCRACLADLSEASYRSVKDDTLGVLSQQTIQAWLAGADITESPGECSLPSQHPVVLYRFLENLSRHLLNHGKVWPSLLAPLDGLHRHIRAPVHQLTQLSPNGIFHLQKAAFTGIANWPHGLFKYLDAFCYEKTSSKKPAKRFKHLEKIQQDWFRSMWNVPDFEFMRQGFVSYLLLRSIPIPSHLVKQFANVAWFVDLTGLWPEELTAQTLNVPVQELLRCSSVTTCRWPRSQNKTPLLFEREKVLALKQKWLLGWSLSEVSSWLGLNNQDVIELVKRGELTYANGSDAGDIHGELSCQSVKNFFNRVTTPLKLFQGSCNDLVRLYEAVRLTSCFQVDCVTLLQGVADGSFPAFKRRDKIRALWDLYFLEALVVKLPDLCFARRGWVEGLKFAQEKGLPPQLLVEWIGAGLIKPEVTFRQRRYFVRKNLELLAATHVGSQSY